MLRERAVNMSMRAATLIVGKPGTKSYSSKYGSGTILWTALGS
jgi:hypothetical protein